MVRDRTVTGPQIDPRVEITVSIIIEEEEIIIMIGITDPTIELEIGQEMAMEIGETMGLTTGKITEGIIIDRIMVTKGIEIGVQVRIMVDPGPDIGGIHGNIQIQEIDIVIIETKAEVEIGDKGPGLFQETGKIVEQGLGQTHM